MTCTTIQSWKYALYSEKLSFCYSKLGLAVDDLIGLNFVIFLLMGHILNFKNITRNRVYFCIYINLKTKLHLSPQQPVSISASAMGEISCPPSLFMTEFFLARVCTSYVLKSLLCSPWYSERLRTGVCEQHKKELMVTKLSVYRMGEVSGEVLRESEYNQEKDRYNKMKIGRAKAERRSRFPWELLVKQLNWMQSKPVTGSLAWREEMNSWDSSTITNDSHENHLYGVSIPPPKKLIWAFFSCIIILHLSLPLPLGLPHYCSHLCTTSPQNVFYFPFLGRSIYLT